jgi:hypothetical protein
MHRQDDPWATLERLAYNTPDFVDLNNSNYDEFLVLITGQMRKRHLKNHLLDGCNWYGEGESWDDNFIIKKLVNNNENGWNNEPMVFKFTEKQRKTYKHDFNMQTLGRIEGDIYGVPLRVLTDLDRYNANSDVTQREEFWITFKNPLQKKQSAKAFVYKMNLDYFDEVCMGQFSLENANSVSQSQGTKVYYF